MAMKVVYNSSAALALSEFNKNNNKLSKDLKKVSSGVRINGAGDGASEYSISEKMRIMVRALGQDIENSKKGKDLLKVAEGGMQNIIEELRTLKELALNSANDHNGDIDRAILQKEFDQRMANISSIAEETSYNGRLLLNGDYRRELAGITVAGQGSVISSNTVSSTTTSLPVTASTTSTSVQTSAPVTTTSSSITTTTSSTSPTTGTTMAPPVITSSTTNTHSVVGPTTSTSTNSFSNTTSMEDANTVTKVKTDTTTTATTSTTVTTDTDTTVTTTTQVSTVVSVREISVLEPPIMITNGMAELTQGGIYQFAEDYTGDLAIHADDVTIWGATATLTDVYITDDSENLYLKNVNISNSQDKSAVNFSGSNGVLHIIGTNQFNITNNSSNNMQQAVIHSNGNLAVIGSGTLDISRNGMYFSGAIIGANMSTGWVPSSGRVDGTATCGDISIGAGLTVIITENSTGSEGAAIGGARGTSCGNISIGTGANVTIVRNGDLVDSAGIGAGPGTGGYSLSGGIAAGCCGDIKICSNANVTVTTKTNQGPAPCIGTGNYSSKCGNIQICSGAQLNLSTQWRSSTPSTSCMSPIFTDDCVAIGAGPDGCECRDIIISYDASCTASKTKATGDLYGFSSGYSSCGTVDLAAPSNYVDSGDADSTDPSLGSTTSYEVTTETITTTITTTTVRETKTTDYETVTETREDVTTTVYEKGEDVVIPRYNEPLVIHTGPKANQHLRVYIEDMGPEALGINDAKVDPWEEAVAALDKIDQAIDYALDQATDMGAYITRLDFTEANLVTEEENTQASESVIRDADMAREMVEYLKDNVLSQASQSMLAQANQNASSVLGLLR